MIRFDDIDNSRMEIKWDDCHSCNQSILLSNTLSIIIRSFVIIFNDKGKIEILSKLFQCENFYVEGDSAQLGWLTTCYQR